MTQFLDDLDARYDNDIISVVLPEFVLRRWWEQLLHNQSALLLKGRLLFRPNTVVISVPFHLDTDTVEEPPGREVEAGTGFNEATEADTATDDGAPERPVVPRP